MKSDMEQFAALAAAGQTASMGVLLAEMQALSVMMSGLGGVPHACAPTQADEARMRAEDAETETAFDNMPV